MTNRLPAPRYCLRHRRFARNDGWLLLDLSLSLSGSIAISGYNINSHRTSVDIYSVKNPDSRDKPTMFYSKEFEKYQTEMGIHRGRCLSFVDSNDDNIVTCVGNKLEMIQVSVDKVLRSRKVNGSAECLFVNEREIFIGFYQSSQVTIYDIDFIEIRLIILKEIADGHCPYDMTATESTMFVCVGQVNKESIQRSLIFEQKTGRILSELTTPKDLHWYKASITVSKPLGVVAVVRANTYYVGKGTHDQIVFYSLLNENNSSIFIVEVESGIKRIRISDRDKRIVTGNIRTGEVKTYDMSQIFSYDRMKVHLASQLRRDECAELTKFLALPKDQTEGILESVTPVEELFFALEEKGVIQPFNVDRLIEAFHKLKIDSSHYVMADIYQRIKIQATLYERFLAILSTHLTASLSANLCVHFNIPGEKRSRITSNQNPGLSLLLALDEMDIINSSDSTALEQPFAENKLIQAVAKIHEYQSTVEEERMRLFLQETDISTLKGKAKLFIKYLQKKIKSWYETMTPVPWKKSCRWKSADLFVACGLLLTDSKTKTNLTNIDEQCKVRYTEIFSHKKLRGEIRIILEGDPGSGKTMLSSQLAYDWSRGSISGINILILLPLKFVHNKTLIEAIRDFYFPEDNSLSLADIEDVIANEGSGCCFLLDGLEEYNSENTAEKPSEIMSIMLKKKYPTCKVVITSRSDYAQDLPHCPILKIGQFGDFERRTYIEKLFPNDVDKQLKVKEVVEDTPFILDLCKVPLLFVLAVHIIADNEDVLTGQLNRVTPFISNVVESLYTPVSSLTEDWKIELVNKKYQDNWRDTVHYTHFDNVSNWDYGDDILYRDTTAPARHGHRLLQGKTEMISLEMLAFNGLCTGNQQLSWPKSFVKENVKSMKQWIDSGILIVEEAVTDVKPVQKTDQKSREVTGTEKYLTENVSTTSVSWNTETSPDNDGDEDQQKVFTGETQQFIAGGDVGVISSSGETRTLNTHHSDFVTIESGNKPYSLMPFLAEKNVKVPQLHIAFRSQVDERGTAFQPSEDTKRTFALENVPLQVKFLHKVIQEWFAARYLASFCWKYSTLPLLKQYKLLKKHLQQINPADLHYVLRFACFLCPPSCHFILNYLLLTYRNEEGNLPDYILNCICLCLAEYEDDKNDYVKDIVSEICKITFTIHSEESRLLQASKTTTLQFASNCGFPISRLQLEDVVTKAREHELLLNSGITMDALQTLQVLEISRWDLALSEEDYNNVIKFIANSASIREAHLYFPKEPPILDTNTKEELKKHVQTVIWKIGSMLSKQLEISTGEWMSTLPTMESNPVEGIHKEGKYSDTVAYIQKEEFIDERGGTLFLREADISLHVPPGALTFGCLISIAVPMDLSSYFPGPQVSPRVTPLTICKPDDLYFKLPVKLTLPHCAVIKKPDDHRVNVKFGYRQNSTTGMIWKSETVAWSLDEHYCSVSLNHFSGVDVSISSTDEKILRVIPYTKIRRNNKLALNVWFCNDLESDFQSVMQTEETNAGIPLDSYDTFCLNYVSGPEKSNVIVNLEELQGNSWHFEEKEDNIHVDRLADKSKSNFLLQRTDGDDESYLYLLLQISQRVGQESRDTTFVIRKMTRDLKTPVLFKKPCCQCERETNHLVPTEKQTRTYTAVVYMDPVKNREDDAILTLWLSPFLSTSEMFQFLQKEQELQLKHRVDSENSFLVLNEKVAVVSKTRFLNGKWILSPEEKKIATDRIRFGSRAKFQFIGRRKENVETDYIDLEVEVFQGEHNKIKFMTDVEMEDLLYEIRRKKMKETTASVSGESSYLSSGVQSERPHQSVTEYASVTNTKMTLTAPVKHVADANAPQIHTQSGTTEERLQNCFMFLKRNLTKIWKDVGRLLHLSEDEICRFSKDDKDDVGENIYQMLLCWQQKNGSRATLEKLVEVLEKVGRSDLAEKLPLQ